MANHTVTKSTKAKCTDQCGKEKSNITPPKLRGVALSNQHMVWDTTLPRHNRNRCTSHHHDHFLNLSGKHDGYVIFLMDPHHSCPLQQSPRPSRLKTHTSQNLGGEDFTPPIRGVNLMKQVPWPQLGPFLVPACPPLTAINGLFFWSNSTLRSLRTLETVEESPCERKNFRTKKGPNWGRVKQVIFEGSASKFAPPLEIPCVGLFPVF